MSSVRHPPRKPAPARRWQPHRIIIARGERIRTFTVRPWLIAGIVLIGAVVSVAYLGATGYLVFRDDLLATSIARQANMQHTYEDRISALRADIDRLTSRQLLNQQEVEAEVDKLVSRQSALSDRQAAISGLSDAAQAAGLPAATVAAKPAPAVPQTVAAPAPQPASKTSAMLIPSVIGTADAAPAVAWQPPLSRMSAVEADLDRIASTQAAYVSGLATTLAQRNVAMTSVLKGLGRDIPVDKATAGVGGPYIPLPPTADPASFQSSVAAAQAEIARYATIRKVALALPLGLPLSNPVVTSGFGMRIDPFLGTPALHPGIDYAAREGQPIGANGPGTVTTAAYGDNGGYGNMVDIDHGNGVVTRYGHLSAIDVRVGQVVAKGTIIGKAGSTGRATGPHLHYEVRVNDEAVDPTSFIAAGEKLAKLY